MNRRIGRVLWVIGCVIGGGFTLLVVVGWLASRHAYAFPNGDFAEHVAGRWDWSTRLGPCGDSSHVIAFSPDRKVMTITSAYWRDSVTGAPTVTTYDVVKVSGAAIRGAIRGETRLTSNGQPVVWDLVMASENEYRWHRADWSSWSMTAAIIRCDR